MKVTNIFGEISTSTYYLRILHDVKIDTVKEWMSFRTQGMNIEITGAKYHRMKELLTKKAPNSLGLKLSTRYAMIFHPKKPFKRFIIIDRVFYKEFLPNA
jgi:hypothetical protein